LFKYRYKVDKNRKKLKTQNVSYFLHNKTNILFLIRKIYYAEILNQDKNIYKPI